MHVVKKNKGHIGRMGGLGGDGGWGGSVGGAWAGDSHSTLVVRSLPRKDPTDTAAAAMIAVSTTTGAGIEGNKGRKRGRIACETAARSTARRVFQGLAPPFCREQPFGIYAFRSSVPAEWG